jgi:hypothetical protein
VVSALGFLAGILSAALLSWLARRRSGPALGDVRLVSRGRHGVDVWIEVDDAWRVAIREHHDCDGGMISHFVSTDGDKPLAWPVAEDE